MRRKRKLVYGVGINDADYEVHWRVNGKRTRCPFYTKWGDMLMRCYSLKFQAKHPTYVGCTVDPDWIYFMAFRAWMMTQDWQGKDLDKDIRVPGNKVYGPDTCLFVSRQVNTILADRAADRGDWPRGVYFYKRTQKFKAQINTHGHRKHLGFFDTVEAAEHCYREAKASDVMLTAMLEPDVRVTTSLLKHAELL